MEAVLFIVILAIIVGVFIYSGKPSAPAVPGPSTGSGSRKPVKDQLQ